MGQLRGAALVTLTSLAVAACGASSTSAKPVSSRSSEVAGDTAESTDIPVPVSDLSPSTLLTAEVPALCQHPAGRLVNGSLPGLGPTEGFVSLSLPPGPPDQVPPVFTDLTGDGVTDAAVVAKCSAGGVSWPQTVLLYGSGPKLLGAADLSTVHKAEHADVLSMNAQNGDVVVAWKTYEGAGSDIQEWSARLHWDGRALQILEPTQTG